MGRLLFLKKLVKEVVEDAADAKLADDLLDELSASKKSADDFFDELFAEDAAASHLSHTQKTAKAEEEALEEARKQIQEYRPKKLSKKEMDEARKVRNRKLLDSLK